jgi:hypothetical protein
MPWVIAIAFLATVAGGRGFGIAYRVTKLLFLMGVAAIVLLFMFGPAR